MDSQAQTAAFDAQFNNCLCAVFATTHRCNKALRNKFPVLFELITGATGTTLSVKHDALPHEITSDFLSLCMNNKLSFVDNYSRIDEILHDETAKLERSEWIQFRVHEIIQARHARDAESLREFCDIYKKDPTTVTATELARSIVKGLAVNYANATGPNGVHFGAAFLYLGQIWRDSNLYNVVERDIARYKTDGCSADVLNYLVSLNRL